MNTHADKNSENKSQSVANAIAEKQSVGESAFQFVDNRSGVVAQKKLQEIADNYTIQQQPIQKKENNTGLPDNLKAGIENLSGYSMDDVKVYYNSDKPAQLQAHAYAQGTDIHLASGQEKHLPHEAWHVVQQKQGRVKPTMQRSERNGDPDLSGRGKININDDAGLEKEADVMGAKAHQMRHYRKGLNFDTGIQISVTQLADIELNASDKIGDDWYNSKTANQLSNTTKAKKKYQQLLYEFFNLTDETELAQNIQNVDLRQINGDFLSSMISLHKHIAPFEGLRGQGFDRNAQHEGNYIRSNPDHPLNSLHRQVIELRGSIPGDWIQPINRALLGFQAATSDQENIDKVVPQESDPNQQFDTSMGRVSTSSAGLPKNNMNLLKEVQKIANTQNLPNSFFTKTNSNYGLFKNPTVNDQGQDKEITGVAEGVRSNPKQGQIGQNGTIKIDKKPGELHQGGYKFTTQQASFNITGIAHPVKQGGRLKFMYISGQARGSLINPAQEAVGDQRGSSKSLLFDSTSEGGINESRKISDDLDQAVNALDGPHFQSLIAASYENGNPHDKFLADRARIMNAIADKINIANVNGVKVVGSEDHPSLILHIPQHNTGGNNIRIYYGNQHFDNQRNANTNAVLDSMVTDFNSGAGAWDVKLTKRGSFGFQQPTIADTGDSVRFWPGYAPVESLTAGLNRIVAKILQGARAKATAANEANLPDTPDLDLSNIGTDFQNPIVHLEGLKTAMRQASISLGMSPPAVNRPQNQVNVATWLKTRMLIKLKQSETILKFGENLVKAKNQGIGFDQEAFNKNYLLAADMNNKLQEYSFMYTASMIGPTTNPNIDVNQTGNFKNDDDDYEKHLTKELGDIRGDHKVFYLDSGEQALVIAGLLANRFKQQVNAQASDVNSSQYQNLDSYFEVGVFGGASRSNLKHDDSGEVIHADLSPVVTSGNRKTQQTITDDLKSKWQEVNGNISHGKNSVIPILDVTNSSLAKVRSMGNMPENYILVESLTKHQQLGADKFTMGRLVAVSSTTATTLGNLNANNFLDLAQQVVGPVANEAFNPVLQKLREQTDKALYKKANPNQFALVLHPTLSTPIDSGEREFPAIDFTNLQLLVPLPYSGPSWLLNNPFQGTNIWENILRNLNSEQTIQGPKIEEVD